MATVKIMDVMTDLAMCASIMAVAMLEKTLTVVAAVLTMAAVVLTITEAVLTITEATAVHMTTVVAAVLTMAVATAVMEAVQEATFQHLHAHRVSS